MQAALGPFVSIFAPQAPEPDLISRLLQGFEEASLNFVMEQAMGPLGELLKPLGDEAAEATQGAIEGGIDLLKSQAEEANQLSVLPIDHQRLSNSSQSRGDDSPRQEEHIVGDSSRCCRQPSQYHRKLCQEHGFRQSNLFGRLFEANRRR